MTQLAKSSAMRVLPFFKIVVLCYLTFCVFLCMPSTSATISYVIGVLSPWNTSSSEVYPFWATRTLGAVSLAVDDVLAAGLLGDEGEMDFLYKNSDCDSKEASGSTVELYSNDHVSSYIAPPCSAPCRSVADLTAYWQKPTLAWFCAETKRKHDEYKYLARTYAPFSSLCNIAPQTMHHFGWNSASIIFPGGNTWEMLASYIYEHLESNNVNVSRFYKYQQPLTLKYAKEILQDVLSVSHVIWLIVGGITTQEKDVQLFMLAAHQLDVVNGDNVFLQIELYPDPGYTTPWQPVLIQHEDGVTYDHEELHDVLVEAFEALLLLTYRFSNESRLESFLEDVPIAFAELPYANGTLPQNPKDVNKPVSIMSAFLYDAVWLYALSLNASAGLDDGYLNNNVSFEGMTGLVMLDSQGDRIYNFSLMDLKNSSSFATVGYLSGLSASLEMVPGETISWPGNKVPNKPKCGYRGEDCLEPDIIIAIVVGALVTMAIIITVPYISFKYRKYLASRDWMMEMDVLTFLPQQSSMAAMQGYPSSYHLAALSNRMSVHSLHSKNNHSMSSKNLGSGKIFAWEQKTPEEMPGFALATYASETVVLRKAKLESTGLNKVLRQELKEMRWLVHDNLNRFLGICFPVKSSDIFYHISEYCSKGSLRSVLANDEMQLDLSFKMSFIVDIAKGMQYLHQSAVKSHGILCSRLCFLDARWVTKISGFGSISHQMFMEKNKKGEDPDERFAKRLWTAPEVLRAEMPPKGSPKGDVYSYGIMLHEILTRNVPYSEAGKTNKAIIRDVMKRKEPPFRPALAELAEMCIQSDVIHDIVDLMKLCWEELPEHRLDFNSINVRLKNIQKGRKDMNIMDNMLSKMEKYTENLEKVVSDRTAQLLEEKAKTDGLLYRMLPPAVAESLKKGEPYLGEFYDHVTLYFSDIVGFTSLSAESSPMQVVQLLNDLYTCFDAVIEIFDVYKVETIGDAYMVSSGLPRRNGDNHAPQIAYMSLAMVEAVKTFKIRHLPERPCQIRIGINSGPVAAGVVGLTMPRFCLFGDTVNTASRMESNGLAQKIHVSSPTADMLFEKGGFALEVRGQMTIKGKGLMNTYWLRGVDDSVKPRKTSLQNAGKKISTDTTVSQDSLLSPANADIISTVSSTECIIPKIHQDKITNGIDAPADAKTGDDDVSHGVDVRARSVSDVINNQRNRMASIAEDAEMMAATLEKLEKHINNGTAMQDTETNDVSTNQQPMSPKKTAADPSEHSSKDKQPQSPRKIATIVPPQVTDIATPTKCTLNEIPILPNVVIYNTVEKQDQTESSFSYTVKGAKTIELEASSSMVEVCDA